MKITWEVDDGYVGKARPQTTEVPDDELEVCKNDEERRQVVSDHVQSDFEQSISPCYDDPDFSEFK